MSKELTAEAIEAAFAAATPRSQGRCATGQVIDKYPALAPKIMDVAHYSAQTVHRVLKVLGTNPAPGSEAISKHRRGACCCREN